MNSTRFMDAEAAATALGISKATLYAYVSRGLIRSEEIDGKSRRKRYLQEDIAALLARKQLRHDPAQVVASALHFGQPLLESAITLIDNGRFYYRGHDVIHLAQTHTFAEVTALIWTGQLTTGSHLAAAEVPQPVWEAVRKMAPALASLAFIDAFQLLLPWVATVDLAAYDFSETAVIQTGTRILTLLTAVAAGEPAIAEGLTIPERLARGWDCKHPDGAELINMALILCADHELNVSSFTARCVASAGTPPYGVVGAGLAALQGTKHGGNTERVQALLREAGDVDAVH